MFGRAVSLVFNTGAGSGGPDFAAELVTLLRTVGIEARLVTAAGHALEAAVRDELAAGAERIVVAGGDGSVSAAANALAGTEATLGILPIGTVNHFAKDLGLAPSLTRNAEVLAAGVVRRVDVATVNGRVFVNNSSIGAYPALIERRKSAPAVERRSRRLATAVAGLRAVRRSSSFRVRIELAGEWIECTTPFVFVGNNAYQGDPLRLASRPRLDAGRLWVVAVDQPRGASLFRAAGRLLVRRPLGDHPLLLRSAEAATVYVPGTSIGVARDGEAEILSPPLDYRILPRALRVLVPKVA